MAETTFDGEKDTMPTMQTLLDAISGWRQESKQQFEDFKAEVNERFERSEINARERFEQFTKEIDERFERFEAKMEARFEQTRLQLMSVEVRLERVEAQSHEVLSVAHQALSIAKNVKADVIVLREEVYSWSKDVRQLQKREAETLV